MELLLVEESNYIIQQIKIELNQALEEKFKPITIDHQHNLMVI